MISNFFTETADVQRMGAATKTQRNYASVGSQLVSEVQPKNEFDLLAGMTVTTYIIYAPFDADIQQQDKLVIGTLEYVVHEVFPFDVRENLKHLRIVCRKD